MKTCLQNANCGQYKLPLGLRDGSNVDDKSLSNEVYLTFTYHPNADLTAEQTLLKCGLECH